MADGYFSSIGSSLSISRLAAFMFLKLYILSVGLLLDIIAVDAHQVPFSMDEWKQRERP